MYNLQFILQIFRKDRIMANVHGLNDLNNNRGNRNNGIRQPMMGGSDGNNLMNEQIRQNRVPFMNSLSSNRPPLDETIPYTLKIVWCPTLTVLSVTTFILAAVWVLYIICLTQGIDTGTKLVLAPTAQTLLKFGAISSKKLHEGQVWRLVTAAFLHADLLHITMNSISFLFFFSRLEKCYSPKYIIPFALASAICGNMASALFNKADSISVGASTIIFGTFGGLIAYMTINWKTLGQIRSQLCCIIGVITVISILMSLDGTVDLAGHLGGLVGGYACGLAIFPGIEPKNRIIRMGGAIALAVYIMTTFLVFYL